MSVAKKRSYLTVRETCIFAMLGALMFASKLLMDVLPNIHLIGMLIVLFTVVFRAKALIPIYVFVTVTGLYGGFAPWWVPYLYIWAVLWLMTMLLPRSMPEAVAAVAYSVVCALHGFLYGILYAPAQALLYGFNFEQTLAWIAAGIAFDVTHGISNFVAGFLVLPLAKVIRKTLRIKA